MAIYRIDEHNTPTPVPDLAAACEVILADTQALRQSRTEDILDLFQIFSDQLLDDHGDILSKYSALGLPFLVPFLRRSNLSRMLKVSLPGREAGLDGFFPLPGKEIQVRARPRGMVVHWLAGNVLNLGIISLVQSLLTRNANIIKLPSAAGFILPQVFSLIKEAKIERAAGPSLQGGDLLKCVMFVTCESMTTRHKRSCLKRRTCA